MQGNLSEHPLAELIHEIKACGLSGVVRVERERVRAGVYAHAGRIVLATANLRSARFAEALKRWNALDTEDWRRMGALLALPAANTDAGLAELLVRERILTSERAGVLLARHTEEILRSLMSLHDGTWELDQRVRLPAENHVRIDEARLLIEAARRAPEAFVATRFEDQTETVQPNASDHAHGIELLPAEGFLLSRIDAAISVGELQQISALPETQARAALYALVLAGLVRRACPRLAFSPEAVARRRDAEAAKSQANIAAATDEAARNQPAESDAERMHALFARAESTDHYALLGISRNAPPDRIKTAYYALAKRFHPDIFDRETTTPEVRARIEAAFARIATAYDVLKNTDARAKYDLKFACQTSAPAVTDEQNAPAPAPAVEQPPPALLAKENTPADVRAEASFREGLHAEKNKNSVLALARFGEAARLAPDQARYRAHYGRALAQDQATRRQAEAELLAAVNLAANDAGFRIMLAEFYRDIGLRLRAVGELERLLAARPGEVQAKKLLTELRRKTSGA